MVGEGDDVHPCSGCRGDKSRGTIRAVRGVGVGVEVDHEVARHTHTVLSRHSLRAVATAHAARATLGIGQLLLSPLLTRRYL